MSDEDDHLNSDSETDERNDAVTAQDAADADSPSGVRDYISPNYWDYGMAQVGQCNSIGYFLPLLRELFNVNDARTKIVYTMLYTLMIDDRVRWTRSELDDKFHWIKAGQRSYLLQRLSKVGWLEYYREQSAYMITDKAETLMRVLSRFNLGETLVQNEGSALAEIEFSMMLDLDDLPDRLKFLRNRLVKHNIRAQTALESESAYRVLEIYHQLQDAHRWAEQTRETLDEITLDDDDEDQWAAIRSVHQHLATLHSQISEMQLVLQDIQRQQINIARYGLTHLDFDNYLINSSVDHLATLMKRCMKKIPHPFFMMESIAFVEAEGILGRDLTVSGVPRGWETEVEDLDHGEEENIAQETSAFASELRHASTKQWSEISDLVNVPSWEVAAYRLSLITMLADLEDLQRKLGEGHLDPAVAVPVQAEFSQTGEMVETEIDGEIQMVTKGKYKRRSTTDE